MTGTHPDLNRQETDAEAQRDGASEQQPEGEYEKQSAAGEKQPPEVDYGALSAAEQQQPEHQCGEPSAADEQSADQQQPAAGAAQQQPMTAAEQQPVVGSKPTKPWWLRPLAWLGVKAKVAPAPAEPQQVPEQPPPPEDEFDPYRTCYSSVMGTGNMAQATGQKQQPRSEEEEACDPGEDEEQVLER